MRAIAICAALALAGCAHHVRVAHKPVPPARMSPATSSAVITGQPRADGEDPATVQTTGAEIRSREDQERTTPPPQPRDVR